MNPTKDDLNFRYLQLQFARLDVLIHRQVERIQHQQKSLAPDTAQNHFGIDAQDAFALLQRPFGQSIPNLPIETEYTDALAQMDDAIAEVAASADALHQPLRLHTLADLLGLDAFERQILIIALAPAFDLRYASLYAFLQDDLTCKWPSVSLILDLLCESESDRLMHFSHFMPDSPLWQYQVVAYIGIQGTAPAALPSQQVYPADEIASWILMGHYRPPALLRYHLSFSEHPQPNQLLLPTDLQPTLDSAVTANAIISLYGIDAAGQSIAALTIAFKANRTLLTLDLAGVIQSNISTLEAIQLLLRDSLLTGGVPYIAGWDACLVDGYPPAPLMIALSQHPGIVITAGTEQWQPHHTGQRRRVRSIAFPGPAHLQREALLLHYLQPIFGEDDAKTGDIDLTTLAQQFQLTTSQIEDTVLTAIDLAEQDDAPLNSHHLFTAARIHSTARLSNMATKIKSRYMWSDLILPQDQIAMLREMVNTIKYRTLVLDEWATRRKLVSSNGVTSLFVGSPGTGKTMAAEVMAGQLEMDLYKIDLSGLVSKYIGETEKNLERVFSEADRSNAILFFDEADSIFGKRSEVKDARDRYANIEISYLLQRMETYNGVTILATNLGSNLDEAFTRRLQFRVNFPDPDPDQRLRIWQQLFPSTVPQAPDLDWPWLAQKFNLTGGNIRNVIVAAAFLAAAEGGSVTMQRILHAIKREMQKMGRMINERDFQINSPVN